MNYAKRHYAKRRNAERGYAKRCYAKRCYAERCYAQRRYAQRRYALRHYAQQIGPMKICPKVLCHKANKFLKYPNLQPWRLYWAKMHRKCCIRTQHIGPKVSLPSSISVFLSFLIFLLKKTSLMSTPKRAILSFLTSVSVGSVACTIMFYDHNLRS